MRDRQLKDAKNSSAREPERTGFAEKVWEIYRSYAGHAAREIARSEIESARRPAWLKALNFAGIALVVIAALILAFGAFKWPDGPIRWTEDGLVGKTGLPHTVEDYEMFTLWERWLFISFPLAFVVSFAAVIIDKVHLRRAARNNLKGPLK